MVAVTLGDLLHQIATWLRLDRPRLRRIRVRQVWTNLEPELPVGSRLWCLGRPDHDDYDGPVQITGRDPLDRRMLCKALSPEHQGPFWVPRERLVEIPPETSGRALLHGIARCP